MMLTHDRLKEVLNYDPKTGIFTTLIKRCGPNNVGSVNGNSYLQIMIDRKIYSAHRLAWLYMKGEWPKDQIDHINGKRDDNRLVNLREATKSINSQNIKNHRKDNACGFLGVTVVTGNNLKKPWQASIRISNKQIYLGCYKTPEAAHEAYLCAKRKLHRGCTI